MDIKIQKEDEYIEYINNHITNVKKAYENLRSIETELMARVPEINYSNLHNTYQRIIVHDASKFSDEEFDAYRRHFHSINDAEKKDSEEDFKEAWKHHYVYNDHHPEHFNGKEMFPKEAVLEMICDWIAMGYNGKPTLSAYDWYYQNKDKDDTLKDMNKNTVELVEKILDVVHKYLD